MCDNNNTLDDLRALKSLAKILNNTKNILKDSKFSTSSYKDLSISDQLYIDNNLEKKCEELEDKIFLNKDKKTRAKIEIRRLKIKIHELNLEEEYNQVIDILINTLDDKIDLVEMSSEQYNMICKKIVELNLQLKMEVRLYSCVPILYFEYLNKFDGKKKIR